MNVSENILKFKEGIPPHVKLVAVSKTKPEELILEAYNAGHKIFGENKVQELVRKHENLPKDIEWHMIGHLQSNKVKYIAPFVNLIHSVDSFKLLETIGKEGKKNDRIIDCLLQLKIAKEETKFGFSFEELVQVVEHTLNQKEMNCRIAGLMGMATYTNNKVQLEEEFAYLAACFKQLRDLFPDIGTHFGELSMGMSDDYQIAVNKGSTIIRIGSTIFGERNYG